jgi:hypothetical protein
MKNTWNFEPAHESSKQRKGWIRMDPAHESSKKRKRRTGKWEIYVVHNVEILEKVTLINFVSPQP